MTESGTVPASLRGCVSADARGLPEATYAGDAPRDTGLAPSPGLGRPGRAACCWEGEACEDQSLGAGRAAASSETERIRGRNGASSLV